ncbi:MAG: zinc dependent phospholipase C family protein, partial [Candidatus Caldatribacteriaceae bacterium]
MGVTLGQNYFSHFHEASTGKGFYPTPVHSAIEGISFDWKVSTMRGPHASGADMCNYYYARAVEELRGGAVKQAMEYLGYALHILADLTVPHHARNVGAHQDRLGETPGGRKTTHGVYEDAVDEALHQNQIPHATFGGIYHLDWTPGEYAVYAASQSVPHLGAIKCQDSGPANFLSVARIMVPLAERLSARLLRRFFEKWKDEAFSVVVLRIDRVKALGSGMKALDSPDEADFYIKVRLGTRQFPESGVIEGEDDVEPNILSEYNWFYPLWVANRTSTVPVEISLWDQDAATGDDHAEIDPGGGADLDFNLNLTGRVVEGDVQGAIARSSHTFSVTGSNTFQTDRAQIT